MLKIGGQERLPFQRLGVLACDLNHDEQIDLIFFGPGFVYFAKNIGSRTEPDFATLKEVSRESPPVAVDGFAVPTVADLNSDGRPDLVVGTEDGFLAYFEAVEKQQASSISPTVRFDGVVYKPASGPRAPASFSSGVYLKADGNVICITTPRNLTGPLEGLWGYTGPALADWDRDGDWMWWPAAITA